MNHSSVYTLRNFLPLIILFVCITAATVIKQALSDEFTIYGAMTDFMGFFFIFFGLFKVFNLRSFAQAYSMYDLIAQSSSYYAFLYPFIELTLGILYLTRLYLIPTTIVTLCLMIVNAIGVAVALFHKKHVTCACLGTVFKIPMTYVTLFEDLLMAGMALSMLLIK